MEAVARLDHPAIVPIYETGLARPATGETAVPYFTMKLIEGENLAQVITGAGWDSTSHDGQRVAAQIVETVARAIHHAHQHGILHRDLKPANILLQKAEGAGSEERGSPMENRGSQKTASSTRSSILDPQSSIFAASTARLQPFVTDFGLARRLDRASELTHSGALVGTPSYMAPEQADERGKAITTATDVFGLGAILYALLTGRPPFRGHSLLATLEQVKACAPAPPRSLNPGVDRDLETICRKCLAREPPQRYASAAAVADDLHRWLAGEPIQARSATTRERLRAWVQRHPSMAAVLLVTAVSVLVLLTGALWYSHQLSAALGESNRLRGEALEREAVLLQEVYATDMRLAWEAWNNGDLARTRELLERHQPRDGEADRRGFEWHYLRARCPQELRTLTGHEAHLVSAAVSPDERLVASCDSAGFVKVWELATGRVVRTLRYSTIHVRCVGFSPDGRTLATAGRDPTVRLWDVATWTERACLRGHVLTINSVAWSPDGRWLVSGGNDHRAVVWDVATQREVHALPGHTDWVNCVAWSPDGKVLATAGDERIVRLWEAESWRLLGTLEGHKERITVLAFSPDSRWLASSGWAGIIVHDVAQRAEVTRVEPGASVLSFSPDGRLLLAGLDNSRVHFWEVGDPGGQLQRLPGAIGHGGVLCAVVLVRGGELLVTAADGERTVKVWHAPPLTDRRPCRFPGVCLAIAPGRDLAVTADPAGTLQLRSFSRGTELAALPGHSQPVSSAVFSPQGDLLATSAPTGQVFLWDTATRQLWHRLQLPGPLAPSLAFSPDGTLVAVGSETTHSELPRGGTLQLWQVQTGIVKTTFRSLGPGLRRALVLSAFSPDGQILATESEAQLMLWRVATGEQLAVLRSSQGVFCLAFSPNGTVLATGGSGHVINLWDVASGRELASLLGHRGGIHQVVFSPDGKTLASFGPDRTVRLWHVATRRELFTLLQDRGHVKWIQFVSPRQLLVGTVREDTQVSEVRVFDAGEP
jgi:WD40 repeat protein